MTRPTRRGAAAPTTTTREEAERLFVHGKLDEAASLFRKIVGEPAQQSWAAFQLGRIASQQDRVGDAIEWFDTALACRDPQIWALYERGRLFLQVGETGRAIDDLVRFAGDAPASLAEGHRPLLLRCAELAFQERDTARAFHLFDLIVARFPHDRQARLRKADLLLLAGDADASLATLEPIADDLKRSAWVDHVRARALTALGRGREAARVILAASDGDVAREHLSRLLVNVVDGLAADGDTEAALLAPMLTKTQRDELALRAALRCKAPQEVSRILATIGVLEPHLAATIADAIDRQIALSEHTAAAAIAAALPESLASSPRILSACLSAAFAQKRWADADALVARARDVLASTGSPDLRLRILEYLCFTLRLDEAETHLATFAKDSIPVSALPIIASLHAARGRWDTVIRFISDSVEAGLRMDHPTLLEALGRAVRRTARYGDALNIIRASMALARSERLEEFSERLLSEWRLREETGMAGTHHDLTDASPQRPLETLKLQMQLRALHRAQAPIAPRSVLLCSDANYLLGTSVALFSLLRNNSGLRPHLDVTMVCSPETLGAATAVCRAMTRNFGLEIDIRPATTLGAAGALLQTGWGLFTPGHGLSAAAYWRITATQRLLAEGRRGRLLYIDSDTLIGPALDDLFDTPLDGNPLGARPELAITEIIQAARGLGIEPSHYFNSGVLLFDLDHAELVAALDEALRISLERPDLLTFVDQCALNLAFQGQTKLIDRRFNDYTRQKSLTNPMEELAVITHFLDRPKPWDPMYAGLNNIAWLREWEMLAAILAWEERRYLLSAALNW